MALADKIIDLSPEEAVAYLDERISQNPSDEEALTERGMLFWKLNRRKDAINDYLAAIKLNPDGRARMILDYANSILDFYNKDLLNP